MRSGVFATPTCATTRLPRQEFIGSGWGTRVGSRSVRARRCPTVTTRPNTKGRYARNGPKERAWASSFRAGSSQSRSESWFNFGNKIVVLDRMDRKPKFWPCKKWPQAYDTIVVVRLFPGSSTVEHSAVNYTAEHHKSLFWRRLATRLSPLVVPQLCPAFSDQFATRAD